MGPGKCTEHPYNRDDMRTVLIALVFALGRASFAQGCGPMPKQMGIEALPSGTIIEKIGTSDMPITTKSEKARLFARQGFALIHCFWFKQAIQSFRDAVKEDPTCAIAWCGLYVALNQPWYDRSDFKPESDYAIKRAISMVETAGDAEQDLIRAMRLASIDDNWKSPAFERAMTQIVDKYPKLGEPSLIWAGVRCQICMHNGYLPNGDVQGDLIFVASLVDPILKRDPNCAGALHYAIHAYEPLSPEKAVAYGYRLTKIASDSGHMLHMPGHVFYGAGLYEDARQAHQRAKDFDEALGKRLNVNPSDADWQYDHNVGFLLADLLEMGRIKEATAVAKEIGDEDWVAWRQGKWADVDRNWQEPEKRAGLKTAPRAMAALEAGDLDKTREKLKAMKDLSQSPQGKANKDQRELLLAAIGEVEGSLLMKEGAKVEGLAKLREAVAHFDRRTYHEPPSYARPSQETLGYALIDAGQTAEAVKAFRDGLKVRRNSGWMLYGIALAYEKAGSTAEAGRAYRQFLAAWPTADADLPQVVHARQFLTGPSRSRSASSRSRA